MTEEVGNEETSEHKTHGEQGGVGVGPLNLQLVNGYIAVMMVLDVLFDERVEGVLRSVIQMVVVQDQRVSLEDLRRGQYEVRGRKITKAGRFFCSGG